MGRGLTPGVVPRAGIEPGDIPAWFAEFSNL